MPASRLVNRNVIAARGRTSMRLEPELWEALAEACAREGISASQLCRRAEAAMPGAPRTSAIRVFLIGYYRAAADEAGHVRAGHGILAPNWRARFAETEARPADAGTAAAVVAADPVALAPAGVAAVPASLAAIPYGAAGHPPRPALAAPVSQPVSQPGSAPAAPRPMMALRPFGTTPRAAAE
ncbi:MAG: ribbon-helix-helix domain-containing protein [Alphaproteobacteria bacterium]|nr:ribbon-helix-helix domain-containing protein [Alphaproteobacteria bacterium]